MSWFNVWTSIKTKTCRYLLQRYLGQFIDETIDLKQLKVDLYNGKATVKNVSLNVTALNAILEAQGWAIEIISGRIGVLTATVPWNALMSQCSCIDVEDVIISVRPVQRKTNGTSMLESMWSSASNSMQLAEECMKQHDDDSEESNQIDAKSIPGLEKFAETIDNILNRIKATFKNTFIQLEYQSSDGSKAISLRFNINELIYENVTGCMQEQRHENSPRVQTNNLEETEENKYLLPMFAKHNISICGLTVSTEELKTMSESLLYENKDFSQSCAIPIMEIREEIHFRIKMKQSENINGPKIIIESEIGSIYTLITPRQIHLILKLIDAFQNDACDKQEADYYEEKQHNDNYLYQKSNETVELGNWIDCETGPSVVNPLPRINLQKLKDLSRGYSPPSSSISSSTTLTGLSKWQRKTSSLEYSGDILSFSVKVSAFVSIVLLEDVLVETESNNLSPLNKTSEQNMIYFAKEFFDHVHQLVDKKIDSVALTCGKNHLFISISPITSGGGQHRIKQMILSKITFAAQKIDLYEVLNGETSELITFDRTENHNTPDVSVHVELDVTSKSVNIALQNCRIELDISIYDRLSAILAPSPFAAYSSKHASQFVKQESSKLTFITNLTSTAMELILRFPIYDARPIHDPNRVPWWQKNVRPDYMIISLDHVCMKFVSGIFDILTNELNAYYVDKGRDDKVWILKTNSMKVNSEVIDYVKISVTIPDEYYWASIKDNFLVGNFNDNIKPTDTDSLPFSGKRFCRESDTIHNKSENMESETMLLPGETVELAEFRRTTMRTSRIQVEVTAPNLHIILESKKFYEVIYNRFNTDLFMWEPSSPILNSINTICVENKQSIYNIPSSSEPQYSRFNEFDLSESEESGSFSEQNINLKGISMTESIYFSTLDSHNTEDIYREEINIKKSKFSINVSIRNGLVELFVPIRDTENQIMPEGMGKIDINVNELKIFSVNGYNDNKNVCYLCIEIDDIKMDHCGLLPGISTKLIAENERNMQKTFYKTPRGLLKSNQPPIKEREMLSLVIETKRVPEQRVKRIVVTTGIQQTTLGYHPSITNQFWLNQLIDFLDVVDYPIEGYVPFGIITEMQLHLWNCAIDYRPTNFDYRAIVELGAFTISSNVISSVAGCNLRFIVEDFVLYIAQNKENTKSQNSIKVPTDSKYLLPVLDIGLVDISVRLNENSEKYPKFDLRCSVHDAHLRTCSDSGKALAQLIEHLANDGDTVEPEQNISSTTTLQQSRLEINETPTLVEHKRKESLNEQQDWQQERVNIMMADALRETITLSAVPSTSKNSKIAGHGIEPFYFPDEQQPGILDDDYDCGDDLSAIVNFEHHVMSTSYCPAEPNVDVLPQIKSDLGDINNERLYRRQPREDEYCVISEDERRKVSQCGVLELKLCEGPIRIVDNHFSLPSNKLDLLKPPDDFPMPVSRYTLCEMTFTWHLYGGKDFLTTADDISAKDDPGHFRMSDAYKHGVSYSKGSNSVSGSKKSKDLSWKTIGGVQRNHDILVEIQLTKVRLSHEIYPTHITQASRQVLVVHDVEIRDRLKSSEINKFLYNPNSKTKSQKCPQQMLVVKALHVRPKPIISSAQECSLRISLLPMRLNIDQDTLIFLADYFTNIGSKMKETNLSDNNQPAEAHAPIMDVELTEDEEDMRTRSLISTNLELLENEVIDKTEKQSEEIEKSSPIYFREVIFGPDVSICFDYHGRRVELSRGPIAGLLMGLGQLQCSEIKLKKIIYRRGFLGVDKLVAYLCRVWLKDIKRNQLPKILKGVGPTYSFVQFIQGVIDLFRLPIEQYQRDGRLIRGIQLGAQSFTARTALAALEITSRVIQILQFTAETAFDMVSSGPSIRTIRRRRDRKRRSNRPKDMREGVTNAYLILKEGINDSATTLIETAAAEHDQKGYTGAVGAVMRQLPQLVVCPAVLATQATTNILGGVKSSLVPDAKVEAREKWKTDID